MILINIDNGNVINASKFSERYIEKLLSTKKFIKESDKFEVSTEQGVEILEQERISSTYYFKYQCKTTVKVHDSPVQLQVRGIFTPTTNSLSVSLRQQQSPLAV